MIYLVGKDFHINQRKLPEILEQFQDIWTSGGGVGGVKYFYVCDCRLKRTKHTDYKNCDVIIVFVAINVQLTTNI